MTNDEIIMKASFELMKDGKIGTSGRTLIKVDKDGNETEVPEPEAIHTFQYWKQFGYSVKKGQKAVAAIQIWKNTTKKVDVEGKDRQTGEIVTETVDVNKMIRKVAYFFSASQVERTKKPA